MLIYRWVIHLPEKKPKVLHCTAYHLAYEETMLKISDKLKLFLTIITSVFLKSKSLSFFLWNSSHSFPMTAQSLGWTCCKNKENNYSYKLKIQSFLDKISFLWNNQIRKISRLKKVSIRLLLNKSKFTKSTKIRSFS